MEARSRSDKPAGEDSGERRALAPDALKSGVTQAPWLENPAAVLGAKSGGVQVLAQLDRYRGANKAASLVFPQRSRFGLAHLFGLDTLRCGRVPERNDVALVLLPLTADNHARSMAISSRHFQILLTPQGLELQDMSKYGTSLNGQNLQGSANIPLDRVSEISVGVSLRLHVTPVANKSLASERNVDPYEAIGPADELWKTAAGLGLGGLFIERVENLADMECYLMVFTWAALGPAFDGEAGGPAIEGGRLRLVRRHGQFWLHNVAAVRPATIAGIPLPVGFAAPLMPDVTLELGGETAEFTAIKQFGIDEM